MRVETFEFVTLFPTTAQVKMFAKVELVYREAFAFFFFSTKQALEFNVVLIDDDYAKLTRDLEFRNASMSKYPDIVKGAILKVQSIFAVAENYYHVLGNVQYWEEAQNPKGFALPIKGKTTKLEVAHLGVISKEGKTKGAKYIEFIPSDVCLDTWYGKACYSRKLNVAEKGSALLALTGLVDTPLIIVDSSGKTFLPDSLRDFANRLRVRNEEMRTLYKKMRACDIPSGEFNRLGKSLQLNRFELERHAMSFAFSFAQEIIGQFAQFAVVAPVTIKFEHDWDKYFLRVVEHELRRVFTQAQLAKKLFKPLFVRLGNLDFCPQCGHHDYSETVDSEVRCSKHKDRFNVFNVCATNGVSVLKETVNKWKPA